MSIKPAAAQTHYTLASLSGTAENGAAIRIAKSESADTGFETNPNGSNFLSQISESFPMNSKPPFANSWKFEHNQANGTPAVEAALL